MTEFSSKFGQQQQLFGAESTAINTSVSNPISSETIEHLNEIIMAQYEMSLYERRIFIKVIEQIPTDLIEINGVKVLDEIIIDAREIITSNGLKGESAYMELQKATSNLIKHVCKISEKDGLLQVALLSSAKYLKGKGLIKLKFDSNLHPYLVKLKNQFNTFHLEKLIHFKSFYSQCLYELFKKVPKVNGTYTASIDFLRSILRIGETEYARYYDFKRYVIQQAQKELLGHEVAFHFKEKKQGKKVIAIQFIFSSL
ncbi:initiator RepB protein (plasmid) [Emticicia oligotrophica DSM 17448]|uniref:Initiator RepB protein n=1 Tax=Emticicia oligotrophica (strain DSM 17448 / CIP 109782 / MTCC 6937 / GPTSA100-15) TaxID=929562 RepID=A0ABN4AWF6_EMTOG|nr:replication initiation protein [Emticicia oligotrophica]AFK05681.1 initiator RepB protein [Emticicia oligotrophica DSM 17448]